MHTLRAALVLAPGIATHCGQKTRSHLIATFTVVMVIHGGIATPAVAQSIK